MFEPSNSKHLKSLIRILLKCCKLLSTDNYVVCVNKVNLVHVPKWALISQHKQRWSLLYILWMTSDLIAIIVQPHLFIYILNQYTFFCLFVFVLFLSNRELHAIPPQIPILETLRYMIALLLTCVLCDTFRESN